MSESVNDENIKYEKNIVEYIYIINNNLFSKTKTIHIINGNIEIPIININITEESKENELFLKPRLIYNDPFRVKGSYLALCDIFDVNGDPYKYNLRYKLISTLDNPEKITKLHPVLYFKQEYILKDISRPKKWSYEIINNKLKYLAEKHYLYCMETKMNIDGYEIKNNKVTYTIGPNGIIGICDDIWLSRYILRRLLQNEDYSIEYNGKLIMNYSDNNTKKENGIKEINKYIKNMKKKGEKKNNIIISPQTKLFKKGTFEDKRYDSNTDPYYILQTFSENVYKN
jgi:hypothetical protein